MDNNGEQKVKICVEQIIGTVNEMHLEKKRMEEMSTSSMDNKNASDENGNKEQKIKKSIKFGGWLPEVLDWIKRTELAQSKLSTSSYTFNQYCWPHLHGWKVKPRNIKRLAFYRKRDDASNCLIKLNEDFHYRWSGLSVPIAEINPPEYIRFKYIAVCFINDRVLQFVQTILPVLNEVEIRFDAFDGNRPQNDSIRHMMELLASKTKKLVICDHDLNDLYKFNRQYPGFINGIHLICLYHICKDSELDLAVNWLIASREDSEPKMLEIICDAYYHFEFVEMNFINRVKEEFINSIEPTNFIICLKTQNEFENFKIENEITGEILELQRKVNEYKYFVVRYKTENKTSTKIDDLEKQFERKAETIIWIDADMK